MSALPQATLEERSDRFHYGDEITQLPRLTNVRIRTKRIGAQMIIGVIRRCQNECLGLCQHRAKTAFPKDFDPIAAGKIHVNDDEVWMLVFGTTSQVFECSLSIARDINLGREPVLTDCTLQELHIRWIVFDNQYPAFSTPHAVPPVRMSESHRITGSVPGPHVQARIGGMSVVVQTSLGGDPEVRRLRVLYRLLASLSGAQRLEEVYGAALDSLLQATDADRAAILLFDDDGVIRFEASRGLSSEYQAAVTGHSPWNRGSLDARAFAVGDVLLDESLSNYQEVFKKEGIRALGFVPLVLDAGVLGKFMLYYSEVHECSSDELDAAQAIASHVALATERKRADIARMKVEQQLQAILDNSATLIWVKDLQGRYQLVNRRYLDLVRVSATEITGRTDHELFPSDLADKFVANDRTVMATRKPLAVEEQAPQDDGLHTYISTKFPLTASDGTIAGICGIATDITDRKDLENASQRLAAIVESSDDAIISKDLDGVITTWNRAAERMFGYTAGEVIGKPVSILAAPGHHNEMPEMLAEVRLGRRVEHFETRRRTKTGEIIDVALTVSPVRDGSGNIVGASKIARDITERKRAEEDRAVLLSREQEARRTAEMLNRVAPRLAAELDLNKLVQVVTDIATELVGAEFGSFFHNVTNEKGESYLLYTLSGVSRSAFEGFPMPRNTAVFGPTFRGEGIVRSDNITRDPRYGKSAPYYGMPKGHLPVCSYLAVPVISRSGEVLGGLFFGHSAPGKFTPAHEEIMAGVAAQTAIAMDNARLFEQAQWVQAELKRSNEDLKRANRDLEVFAYSASHDLQEPIRTIAISAQLIDRTWGRQLQGEDAMFLDNILAASRRMGDLTEDVLTYMRAGKSEEGPTENVDAGRVLSGVVDAFRGQIQGTGASVTAGPLPSVAMHESRLGQVFQNLIGNALKYRGKAPPRIQVAAHEREGWHVFSISDNGIGIEPHLTDQIFGLFKRLHGRDEYPGSGVGLAICQRIVEQYQGKIWLETSVPGQGSTFCFSVPCRV